MPLPEWKPSKSYVAGDIVNAGDGHFFATNAGLSGPCEPLWGARMTDDHGIRWLRVLWKEKSDGLSL